MLDVSKKMLIESSRNPVVATVEKEAGWLLLSSLLASMPKEVGEMVNVSSLVCSFLYYVQKVLVFHFGSYRSLKTKSLIFSLYGQPYLVELLIINLSKRVILHLEYGKLTYNH